MIDRKLIIIGFILGLSHIGCSVLERSPYSGYYESSQYEQQDPNELYKLQKKHEISTTKEELGLNKSTQLSEEQIAKLNQRLALKSLEDQLQTQEEKKQYYGLKPYFKSDVERIQFLKLPSLKIKNRYAEKTNLKQQETDYDETTIGAIEGNDIILGMTRTAVRESWGDPDEVEIAGNPIYGNERWNYRKQVSSNNGYKRETRVIVFEAGKVAGWETF